MGACGRRGLAGVRELFSCALRNPGAASNFTFGMKLFSNLLCVIERLPGIVQARSGNLNLERTALMRQKPLEQAEGDAPAREHSWDDGLLDAEGQSHESGEFLGVRHVGPHTAVLVTVPRDHRDTESRFSATFSSHCHSRLNCFCSAGWYRLRRPVATTRVRMLCMNR